MPFGLRPRGRTVRNIAIGLGAVAGLFVVSVSLLWWRLANGPISLDLVTPWLSSAIEQNFGARHKVEVGGTVIEQDDNGRIALRIRDIVVRDADGTVVASAPRAEVGLSGSSLLTGHLRASSLNLVGAALAVRVERDGQVTVFAGADKRPIATAPAAAAEALVPATRRANDRTPVTQNGADGLAAFLAWIDSLSNLGLDGYDLTEIGLKSGTLTVDDQRNGRQSNFQKINLSLTRPQAGEIIFSLGSDSAEKPWSLLAGIKPNGQGRRVVSLEARKILLRDILLCFRQGDEQLEADIPLSVSLHGEMGADGTLDVVTGRALLGPGIVGDAVDPLARVLIERAEFNIDWDAARHTLVMPLHLLSGGNRFAVTAQAEVPHDSIGVWGISLAGTAVLAPVGEGDDPLPLDRILVRGHFDPKKRRLDIDQGDVSGKDVAVAGSGNVDFSTADPRIAIGIATRNVSFANFKQIWPSFVNPPVRLWVLEHFFAGTVDGVKIATNAPFSTMKANGPPMTDDGLSIELTARGVTLQPLVELPAIKDADLTTHIVGRGVSVSLGKGTAEVSPGHKLTLSNGLFEIPDSQAHPPQARVHMRIEGPVPVAAELLANDRLRVNSGPPPLDPATSRGTVMAQVALAFPIDLALPKGATNYAITADLANFAVDKFMMAQRVEAQTLRVIGNNQGYQVKGDVKISGMPASIDFRKPPGDEDADLRMQATFDDAARARMGFDLYGALTGPVPAKITGKIASFPDRENRFSIETDLTQAKVDSLLPGWVKPAGKPSHANFTLITKGKASHFEDLVIEGSGTSVKGTIDIDANGDVQSANFPVFGLADTDKATLKAERTADGALKAVLHGDLYDGRNFVKSILSGSGSDQKARQPETDLDLEVKIGTVIGFNGEALRGLDLKLSRRGGHIRNFALNGKLGDAPLVGDLRSGKGSAAGRQVVYFETKDAGALFRFTNTYPHMHGGEMWAAMDPPSSDHTPQDGILNIRDFSLQGERQLEGVVAGTPGTAGGGLDFTQMRVEFTRSPGKLAVRDGLVQGPGIGVTIDGQIDYAASDVRLHGTFLPLYEVAQPFDQVLHPLLNRGLFGMTYEVVGAPGDAHLRVNPISAIAPGFLRKPFEYQTGSSPQQFPNTDVNR
jgi:hypothetical protein